VSGLSIFPIIIKCDDKGWSERSFEKAFIEAKPKEKAWFAYDVEIASPTTVVFRVFDMRDSFYGGVGDVSFCVEATVSPELTRPHIEREIHRMAAERRATEIEAYEARLVARYADEIREALSLVRKP
jgi:hypothetical protein